MHLHGKFSSRFPSDADSEDDSPTRRSIQRSMAIFKLKGRKAGGKGKPPQNERIDSTIGAGVLLTAATPELAVAIGIRAVLYVSVMHELISLMHVHADRVN